MAISRPLAWWIYTNPSVLGTRSCNHAPLAILSPPPRPSLALWKPVLSLRINQSTSCSSVGALLHPEEGLVQREEEELISAIGHELSSFETVGQIGTDESLLQALTLVDLTGRLGIQRYFEHHIEKILSSTFRRWDEKQGLQDAHLTVLAFRLLRLHGFPVFAEAIVTLTDPEGSFSTKTPAEISGILNLYRCSQVSFPCESKTMREAKEFARSELVALLDDGSPVLQTNNLRSEGGISMPDADVAE